MAYSATSPVPTQLIWGELDARSSLSVANQFERPNPDATLHFRPYAWHGHDGSSIVVYDRYRYGQDDSVAVLSILEEVRAFWASLGVDEAADAA